MAPRAGLMVIVWAVLVPGCTSSDADPSLACGPNGACPSGYSCDRAGHCQPITAGAIPDAAQPADAPLVALDAQAPSPTDAGVVAPPDAELPISVTVRLRDSAGAPILGGTVALADRAGELTGAATTDADGTAVVMLPAGGMVTYAVAGTTPRLVTVMGISDGDVVDLGAASLATGGGPGQAVVVSWSAPQAGASQHGVEIGCHGRASTLFGGPSDTSVQITVAETCLTAAQSYTVVGWAIGGSSSDRIAYAIAADIPAAQTAVDLPPWKTDLASVSLQVTGAPACGSPPCATASGTLLTADERMYQLTGGGDAFTYPPGLGTTFRLSASYHHGNASADGYGQITRRTTDLPAAAAFDLAAQSLPRMSQVSRAGTNARPIVSFTAAAPTGGADVLLAAVGWKEGQVSHRWTLVAPPGTASPLRAPALPAAIADQAPSPGAAFVAPSAGAVDTSAAAGFHEAIASPQLTSSDLAPGAELRVSAAGDFFQLLP